MKDHRSWWQKAIVYQIYPRSFYDSDADGVGDLNGIRHKLDYIRSLGANVIWLCPVYRSPMVDNGYDISDYRRIDPIFGTDDDMAKLIAEAGGRGIKILMDLVVNHTSDRHPWFQEALRDPRGKYADYYLFRRGEDGRPPNNLRDYFGTPAWSNIPGTDRWYFHAFAPEQPDLNWENPAVRAEIRALVNWWLDQGLGGFRIDAIGNIKKSPEALACRAFPADGPDGLASIAPYVSNQPGIGDFLKELADTTFRPRDAMTVAEADVPADQLRSFIGKDGYFSMTFDFSYSDIDVRSAPLFEKPRFTVNDLRDRIFESQLDTQRAGGWAAPYLENHDQPRSLNKYLPPEATGYAGATMLATLFLCLRGTPFIYQGQELGMTNSPMALDDFRDLSAFTQYRQGLGMGFDAQWMLDYLNRRSRDHARTPFQWDASANAGFTRGTPWLKVNPNYPEINAAAETADPHSVLNYYKKLIRFRQSSPYADVMTFGDFLPLKAPDGIIAYRRSLDGRAVAVINNFSAGTVVLPDDAHGKILLANLEPVSRSGGSLTLLPYQSVLIAHG